MSGVGVAESAASLRAQRASADSAKRQRLMLVESLAVHQAASHPPSIRPFVLNSSDDHGCVPMKTVAGSRADIAGHTNVLAVSDWFQIGLKDSPSFVLQLQCISKSSVLSKDRTTFSRPLSAMPNLACL
jgi:hypothetical protein